MCMLYTFPCVSLDTFTSHFGCLPTERFSMSEENKVLRSVSYWRLAAGRTATVWGDTIPLLVSFARFLTLCFSSKSRNICCACVRNFCSFSSTDRTFALQFLHKCLGRPSSSVTISYSSLLAHLGQSSFKLDDEKSGKECFESTSAKQIWQGNRLGPVTAIFHR